jgi:hypothetical protein
LAGVRVERIRAVEEQIVVEATPAAEWSTCPACGERSVWAEPAQVVLRRLGREVANRVRAAVQRLAATGHRDVRRLQDVVPPEWRLRFGDWRVHFFFDLEVS